MVIEEVWYDISRFQQQLYSAWRLVWLRILHICCACITMEPHSIGDLWIEQQQWYILLSSMSKHVVLLRMHSSVRHLYWSNHPTRLSVLNVHCACTQLARKLIYSLYQEDLLALSAAWRLQPRYKWQCHINVASGPGRWMQWWQKKPCLLC
jgi:hypothetical protein